jgi:hypothetical protein
VGLIGKPGASRENERHGVPTIGTPGNSMAWIAPRRQPKKSKGLDCQTMASEDIQWLGVHFNGADCPSLASRDIQKHGLPTEGTPGSYRG